MSLINDIKTAQIMAAEKVVMDHVKQIGLVVGPVGSEGNEIDPAKELLSACKALIAFCDKTTPPMGDSLWSIRRIRAAVAKLECDAVNAETQIRIDAAVKSERDRVCDLFLTEPISFPVGVNTDEDEIDASIKSDRFKLMTAVREGKQFKEVMDSLPVAQGGAA